MNTTLKNILFISVPTFIVLFTLLEIGVRLFKKDLDLNKITGRTGTLNPMNKWAKNDVFSAYSAIPGVYSENKTVNSFGFMSTPEIELKKMEKTTRIVFLGGSSTAGTGRNLIDEETWPWKTIEKLKNETHNIDFINAAQGGYSTYESYGKLWSRLRFFKPDIVIVYHGWNDMYYFNSADKPLSFRDNFDLGKPIINKKIEAYWFDPYIGWSQLLSRVRFKLGINSSGLGEVSAKNNANELKDSFNQKGLDIYRQNIKLIRDFCINNSIEFYICKQGTLIHPTTKEADKKRCRYDYHGFNHDSHINAFNNIYQIIDEEIPKRNIIDVTSISGVSEYFYDHIHQTELGTDKISEIVKDSLVSNFFKIKK